jgi:hypothetical protein
VGTATVRVDRNVPTNAALARHVADNPPIQRDGQTVTLRPPSDPAEQRAVTVSFAQAVSVSLSRALNCGGARGGRGASATADCLSRQRLRRSRDSPRETLANLSITGHLRCFSDQPGSKISLDHAGLLEGAGFDAITETSQFADDLSLIPSVICDAEAPQSVQADRRRARRDSSSESRCRPNPAVAWIASHRRTPPRASVRAAHARAVRQAIVCSGWIGRPDRRTRAKPRTMTTIEARCATENGPTTRSLTRRNSIAKRIVPAHSR